MGAHLLSSLNHPLQRFLPGLSQHLGVFFDFTANDVSQPGHDITSDMPGSDGAASD
jgi:hypothetical protein